MLPYAEYPFHSISMTQDEILKNILENLAKENIEIIIETGTFNGLGSTTFVSNAFEKCNTLKTFYTLEVNPNSHADAVENLKKFPKVVCLNGASLNLREALNFVENDEAINHHERYPDIFIDTLINPVAFYANELKGLLGEESPPNPKGGGNPKEEYMTNKKISVSQPQRPFSLRRFLRKLFGIKTKEDLKKEQAEKERLEKIEKEQLEKEKKQRLKPTLIIENLLEELINKYENANLFVILDSAGGVGYMEFQKVMSLLGKKSFYLMLDDTHHLKHFRSLRDIQQNPNFNILGVSKQNGWCVAKHL